LHAEPIKGIGLLLQMNPEEIEEIVIILKILRERNRRDV
jgi:hypothetical protein